MGREHITDFEELHEGNPIESIPRECVVCAGKRYNFEVDTSQELERDGGENFRGCLGVLDLP